MGSFLFDAANLVLAAAMYTLIGRYILSLFFSAGSDAVIWRVFQQVTDPIVRAVSAVTPRYIHPPLVPLLAVVWILLARVLLALGTLAASPPVQAGG